MNILFLNSRSISRVLGPIGAATWILVTACSSDNSSAGGDGGASTVAQTCGDGGTGITAGPVDTHCESQDGGAIIQATSLAGCHPDVAAAPAGDGTVTESMEAGIEDGTCGKADYRPTMYGQSGSDDDCKYDVSWAAQSPICVNSPVYFSVTATVRSSHLPLTVANTTVTPVLSCVFPAQVPSSSKTTEPNPGNYIVGPVTFPKSGVWNVRFHFNEDCDDTVAESPHGHAAFWVTVP